jgi:deoxyadenosine/deoxycytidine kinase
MNNSNIEIISIEGNIGSGKSTLLKKIKDIYSTTTNIVFLREPVEEWEEIKDKNGETMLQKFYADQEKYSFSFQMMAYISRLKILRDAVKDIELQIQKEMQSNYSNYYEYIPKKYIIITERSLYTDKYVFAKMLYDQGKIEDVCYQIYLNWFDEFAKDYPVSKLIYVSTDPFICSSRINKRSRLGEEVIPTTYLQECHKYHEEFIYETDISNRKIRLVLNGNDDIYENPIIIETWLSKINNLLNTK